MDQLVDQQHNDEANIARVERVVGAMFETDVVVDEIQVG